MYLTILSRVLSTGTDIGIRMMLGRFLEASSAGRLRMVALHMLRSSRVKSSRPAVVRGWVTALLKSVWACGAPYVAQERG